MYKSKANLQKGFTLIEMIVSLGIFTVVAVVAVGALIKVMDANKKSINLKNTINNLNFTLESMSREMRVGSNYDLTTLGSNSWQVAFTPSKKNTACPDDEMTYIYKFENHTIKKAEGCKNSAPVFNALISPNVYISDSTITVDNSEQPYIFFGFTGYSGVRENDRVDFSLQTRVSQRIRN